MILDVQFVYNPAPLTPDHDFFVYQQLNTETTHTGPCHPGQHKAKVAELADALVLGTSGVTRGSSSLPFRTIAVATIVPD